MEELASNKSCNLLYCKFKKLSGWNGTKSSRCCQVYQ